MKHSPYPRFSKADQRNLFLAIALSAVLVIAWQVLVESPKRRELAKWHTLQQQKKEQVLKQEQEAQRRREAEEAPPATREARLAQSARVGVDSGKLRGSIALKGLRFDDLLLARYRVGLEPQSGEVTLLSPAGGADAYFMQAGWLASKNGPRVPDETSLWRADRDALTPEQPVTFRWDNGQGLLFSVTVRLDKDYMFHLLQTVENRSGQTVTLTPYAFINRAYQDAGAHAIILHEGPLGVLDGALSEIGYKTLREEGPKKFEGAAGWLGITDKYWLTALMPGAAPFNASMSHYQSKGQDRYQAEATPAPQQVADGESAEYGLRFFAGAKEIGVLDAYAQGDADNGVPPIPLFDRAVDFGALYFLTKPMFLLLTFFYAHLANFGLAIMLLTVVIKLLMYPLANKGYHATTQMRALQPEMMRLKEAHGKDRMRMQQELAALYKREKVNPAAGCLPVLVQIPVFFALYKVLFVTIEMRHAPFFGWLRDLSAPDPSNIFTLFGLIPWNAPPMMHVGILPILMGVTMWLQMRQQPKPNDPTQARVLQYMPYFLTFLLASMPAGLVLYWTWSNTLSILQQWLITRRYNETHPAKPAL